MEITEFLLARFAEDMAAAQAEIVRVHEVVTGSPGASFAIAAWQRGPGAPERVVDEIEAKRRIVSLPIGNRTEHDLLLRTLALPYADRPDFREEWRL